MQKSSRQLILIALMTGLTCTGGFLRIPFFPVPITLQTLFVYMSGLLLEPRQALISQSLYLILGLAGLPVFATGGGPAYVLSPTFGYLLGFPVAAWASAMMVKYRFAGPTGFKSVFSSLGLGMSIILGMGAAGLIVYTRFVAGKPVEPLHLFRAGVLFMLPGEICKIILASQIVRRLTPAINRSAS
ncbi:biotin transporter BioY [bacterium]|nr:biotin transporter BioY [bacterium]